MRAPSGTVTFLLTDVESSTRAWQADPGAAAAALARQEKIVAGAVCANRGFRPVEQGEGDSVVAVFTRASDAVAAAVAAQLALSAEPWPTAAPIRVRMALHTGEAEAHDDRYAGPTIIRAARLRAVGHGGQTLVSRATAELVGDALADGVALVDLGTHRLRDLARAEHVFQLSHPGLPGDFPLLRSLDRVANNLPAQLTSFIGREAELAQVERLLAQVRLLTLTGAGGCGKTRLAAHAAALVAERYPAGVWWVELAPLRSGSAVSTAVLCALGLRELPSRSALDQLADHFTTAPALVVVDNCEHLLDEVAGLLEPWLAASGQLTVLATSREQLGVAGETTWRVPPLAVPAPSERPTPDTLAAYDAVALFVARARQARPNFSVTNDNAPAVAEICSRLDGIPLAIELAAARVRVLSCEDIRAGLDDRFRLLTGGSRSVARQQTLAASVEWSHDLLDEPGRALLRRLAVFAGGFTLDAAEAVCCGDGVERLRVLDLLAGLVDKSLVVASDHAVHTRYRLLETIRQFALQRLERSGEAEAVRRRHAALLGHLAADAERAFMADDALTARQEAEHDNLRAALEWTLAEGRVEEALGLLCGLANLWLSRGLLREAFGYFDRVLGHAEVAGHMLRYRGWWARGVLALIDGRPDPALEMAAEVVEQARQAGDDLYVARAMTVHGTVVTAGVDPAAGEHILLDAVALADRLGDPFSSQWSRVALMVAGIHLEDHRAVAAYADEARPMLDAASGHMRSMYHGLAGFSDVRIGRFDEARRHGEIARRLAAEAGDPTFAGAMAAATMALLELAQGRVEAAAEVLEPMLREPRASGPTREDPMLIGAWGRVLAAGGDRAGAQAAFADAVRLGAQVGDAEQYGLCLAWQAAHLRAGGDHDRARPVAGALREHARRAGHVGFEAMAGRELAYLARHDGDLECADDLAHRALARSAAAGILPDVIQDLIAVAGIAAAEESWEEAVRLFAASDGLGRRIGGALPSWDEAQMAADLDLSRRALDPATFQAAWAQGAVLDVDEAVAYAQRGRGERKRPPTGWASLTPMERQVVDLVAKGLRNTEIADRLFVAPSTIKTHLGHVFAKLGVTTRAELAVLAAARKA